MFLSGDCAGDLHDPVCHERGPLLRDGLSSAVAATPHSPLGSGRLRVRLDW